MSRFSDDEIREHTQASTRFEEFACRHLDPVLNPRGFRLTAQSGFGVGRNGIPYSSAVYEAEPKDFARRYPRLGEPMSHDPHYPCIDFWVKQDEETHEIFAELEGYTLIERLTRAGKINEAKQLAESPKDDASRLRAIADAVTVILDSDLPV